MRKFFVSLAVLAVTGVTAIGFVGCKVDKAQKSEKASHKDALELNIAASSAPEVASGYSLAVADDALMVMRFDLNQVLEKSGIKADLLKLLREKLQEQGAPEAVVKMTDDLRTTGIDVEAPMYLYVREFNRDYLVAGFVAKTHDKALLDKLVALMFEDENVKKSEMAGCTIIDDDENAAFAYNDTAVVYASISLKNEQYDEYGMLNQSNFPDIKPLLVADLERTISGKASDVVLPAYKGSDVAVCLVMEHMLDMVREAMTVEDVDANPVEKVINTMAMTMLEKSRNGKIDIALNFADGSINLDAMVTGFAKLFDVEFQPCSNKNLDKVSADAWVVANVPFNGAAYIKAIKLLLKNNPDYKRLIEKHLLESDSDVNLDMMLNMALSLLGSVDGDITVALNDIKSFDSDSFAGAGIDVCAMVNVNNSSIMNALETFGIADAPGVERCNNGSYCMDADGANIYFGQKDNRLYVSTPKDIASKKSSATSASWYPAVKNSYGYAVINLSSVLSIPEVKKALDEDIKAEQNSKKRASKESAKKLINSLDYLLFTATSPESVSLRLVLKNKNENVLKQVVDSVKPLIDNL
jgi:hypothetical protein